MRVPPASRNVLENPSRVRRGQAVDVAAVVVPSAAIAAFVISRPHMNGLVPWLTLVPAFASVVARIALEEGSRPSPSGWGAPLGSVGRRAGVDVLRRERAKVGSG